MTFPRIALVVCCIAGPAHAAPQIAGCPVLPADNVWNAAVDQLPVHASSAAWVNTIGPGRNLHPDFGTFFEGAPIGIPFVTVSPTQPRVPVVFDVDDESDPGPYPIPPDAPIEGGPVSTGDRHVIVIERDNCVLYELFDAAPAAGGTSWRAYSGARFDLRSNALRPDTWTSADAAGLPILPGLVRYDEVAAGEIAHAIRFTAPQTRRAHVWPARHHASTLTGAEFPPMGARFRLKSSVDISGFSARNQVILRALRKYGMILADNGSSWFITGQHHASWSDEELAQLKSLRGSDFEAVDTASLMVAADSGKAFMPPPQVTLRPIAEGLGSPVAIVNARDGSGRLFFVELDGAVRVLRDGALLPTPFLDLGDRIQVQGEGGLLGLAFDPRFASNRRFYVFYTNLDGDLRIERYLASAGNPDVAIHAGEHLLTIAHPTFSNHNGGHLAFGPDGYLYIGVGDGGSGGDPSNNAQNLGVLLGKLLRLDVDVPQGYAIPPDNPFIGVAGARPEIWAYGLRNPWRFSFDRVTGDLYIGDVGQGLWEEIDYVPAPLRAGLNFGWRVFEGPFCYNAAICAAPDHAPPVLSYGHDDAGGISVTGGYVYRGKRSRSLRGYYLYGDFGSNRIWAAQREGDEWRSFVLVQAPNAISGLATFGEDEEGEIYVASLGTGQVFHIAGPDDPAIPRFPPRRPPVPQ